MRKARQREAMTRHSTENFAPLARKHGHSRAESLDQQGFQRRVTNYFRIGFYVKFAAMTNPLLHRVTRGMTYERGSKPSQ
jgi:hypothetical protein